MLIFKNTLKGCITEKNNIKGKLNNEVKKVFPELEDIEIEPTAVIQQYKSEKYGFNNVTVKPVTSEIDSNIQEENIVVGKTILGVQGNVIALKGQEKNVTPSVEEQIITPNDDYNAITKVTVGAVDNTIDNNIQASNIKKDVSILGINGTLEELKGQEKTIEPSIVKQDILPSEGFNAFTKISVDPVTNNIDENIQSSNIKKGVSILGVDGIITELDGEEITVTPTREVQVLEPAEPKNAFTKVTVNAQTGYDTSDANAVSDDVLEGKIAYNSLGRVVGTLKQGGESEYNAKINEVLPSSTLIQAIEELPASLDVSALTTGQNMFSGFTALKKAPNLIPNTTKFANTGGMFRNCSSLTTIPLIDTSNVTVMDDMFNGCTNLISIPLLNTSKVTRTYSMFYGCTNLKSIPALDLSKITLSNYMFRGCNSLVNLPNLNLPACTDVGYMFYDSKGLTECTTLNTPNATNMTNLFYGCSNLTKVANLDIGKATNLYRLFYACSKLEEISFINADITPVTTLSNAFYGCSKLTTIPAINCSKVTDMTYAFNSSPIVNFGGFLNYGQAFTTTASQNYSYYTLTVNKTGLTRESMLNIINGLYDIKSKGCKTQTVNFGTANLVLLTDDEKAIATNKGWTLK